MSKINKWVIIIFAVGMLFAIDEHCENQKLLQLKEISKRADIELQKSILENRFKIERKNGVTSNYCYY